MKFGPNHNGTKYKVYYNKTTLIIKDLSSDFTIIFDLNENVEYLPWFEVFGR